MVAEFKRPTSDRRITDLQINAQMQLEEEILEAGLEQHFDPNKGKFQLAQIAKWTGVPVETVEQIAHSLVSRRVGVDLEESEFNSMIEQVRTIESVLDDGFKEFKLEKLARRYKLPKTAMMNCFYKALINQAPFIAYGVEDLDQLCQVEKEWLVSGWIPKGIVLLLHAMGGVGKSLMIYELIECIAKGQPWNGYQISQGRVLILQSDEPVVVTRERMQIRELTNNHPVEVVPGWQVENIARLEAYLKKYQEAGDPVSFCMIDSVTSINRNTLISENDTEYARFMLQLNDLGDRYGCTFCVIHHSNSEGESRGTKALYNSASEVWGLLLTDERSGDRVLRVQKTRMGRPPGRYAFRFDEDRFTFEYLGKEGSENEEETIHTEKRIELWLNEDDRRGVRYEIEEMAQCLNINKNTIRRVLKEMWAKGMVSRCLKGQGNTMLYYLEVCRSVDRGVDRLDRPLDN
ncbi:AAA family ATPase [Phormidesmis sp. 146-33]